MLQLTSYPSIWTFSCNVLGTVSFPNRDCLLRSNPIKAVFYFFQCLCHPSYLPLAHGTHLTLPSLCRHKHPFVNFKLFHIAQYAFVRGPSVDISFLVGRSPSSLAAFTFASIRSLLCASDQSSYSLYFNDLFLLLSLYIMIMLQIWRST